MGRFDVGSDEKSVVDNGLKAKHVIRGISKTGSATANEFEPVAVVDAYISQLIVEGWKLKNTHYLGEHPEGFNILYIFEK